MPADDLIKVTIRGRGFKYGSDIPIQLPWIFTPQYDGALVDGSADDGRGIIFDASPLRIVPDVTGYIEFDVPSVADSSGNPTGYTIKVQDPTRKKPYNISPDHTLITPDPTTGKYYYDLKDVVPPGVPLAGDSVLIQGGISQAFADAHYVTTAAISGKANTTDLTAETSARTSADATLSSSVASKADAAATTTALGLKADASALTSGLAAKADATALTTETTNRTTADGLKIDKAHLPAIAADAASVDNTGATDTGTALQAFLDSLAGTEQVARLYGTFRHSATIVFKGHVDASGATFNYTGTGTAVQVGPGTSAVTFLRYKVSLPKIINTTKPGTGWTASTVGVKAINFTAGELTVPYVTGFETGLILYGLAQGTAYAHVRLGHLDNNKVNIQFDANSTGFVNQNTVIGGRCSHNSGEGSQVSGTRHVQIASTTSLINANTFVGTSLESPDVVEYHIECFGQYNEFHNCRFENSGGDAHRRVWSRGTATGNRVLGGFNAGQLTQVVESTAYPFAVQSDIQIRHYGGDSTRSALLLENKFSSNSPTIRGLAAGATLAGDDPTTNWTWQGASSAWGFKRAGDAFARVLIDAVNGQVLVGNGTATPTTALGSATGSTINAYTTAGTSTWTKPAGCNAVMVLVVNAGAGGGSGRRGAAASVRCGGGGGAGGGYSYRVYPASVLSSTETVTVGAGGAGGAAVTADSTDGNPGGAGGVTFFKSVGATQMGVPGGGGGGTATTGTAGGAGMVMIGAGGPGAAASTTGLVGAAPSATNVGGATGGGSGGGVTSADAVSAGGAGASLSGLIGGTAGTTAGGTGGAGGGSATDQPGTGGGGGGSSITGAGGTGGAGALCGGGGGGGGASLNGNASGAGGAGANGVVVVVSV